MNDWPRMNSDMGTTVSIFTSHISAVCAFPDKPLVGFTSDSERELIVGPPKSDYYPIMPVWIPTCSWLLEHSREFAEELLFRLSSNIIALSMGHQCLVRL